MIPFHHNEKTVTDEDMTAVYEKIKTPVKYGAVIKYEDRLVDSPTVFKKDGLYYMLYISIAKKTETSGYETHLAKSENLKDWEEVGTVFRREDSARWDSGQCSAYLAFPDIRFGGTNEPEMVNGTYYVSYMGSDRDGYEPDPLLTGLARVKDLTDIRTYQRLEQPILRPDDADAREQEKKTLYKSCLFRDPQKTTGFPYVNVYNAKDFEDKERIFLAVSTDGEHWERYGDKPAIDLCAADPRIKIAGDPQIILIDDIYVMFFFVYDRKTAYNTFACSRDLINWKIRQGEPLVKPEYEWENRYAHKTWFLRENGVNYHFYCAVNDQKERFIALATS